MFYKRFKFVKDFQQPEGTFPKGGEVTNTLQQGLIFHYYYNIYLLYSSGFCSVFLININK